MNTQYLRGIRDCPSICAGPPLGPLVTYNTFDVIKQDPKSWAARVEKETTAKVVVMKPGDTIEV